MAGGRTAPQADFHLVTHVVATGRPLDGLGPDHDDILSLCRRPISVAEVSALRLESVLVGTSGVSVLEAEVTVALAGARPDTGPRRLG